MLHVSLKCPCRATLLPDFPQRQLLRPVDTAHSVLLTAKALLRTSSLCDCVAQIPVCTLNSKSSIVRLLRIKNLSFCGGDIVAPPSVAVGAADFVSLVGDVAGTSSFVSEAPSTRGDASSTVAGWDAPAAGPVGAVTPLAPSTVFFRKRLTSRTVWNFESCNFCCAATQLASSLKFAKAQLLFDMRNSDSKPGASLQTWWTRLIKSVCGGRLPIQIACPVSLLDVFGPSIVVQRVILTTLSRFARRTPDNVLTVFRRDYALVSRRTSPQTPRYLPEILPAKTYKIHETEGTKKYRIDPLVGLQPSLGPTEAGWTIDTGPGPA